MKHTIYKSAAAIAALSLLPLGALADTAVDTSVNASASVTAPGVSTGANANVQVSLSARAAKAKEKADQEIDRRTKNLNDVSARVDGIKNLSESDKASIKATLSNNLSGLAELKTKIDADADAETLRTDVKTITASYRVYALLLPQVRIIAAADRVVTIATEMQAFSAKLEERVSAAEASGADMTAAASALADFNAKVSDAGTQAQAAVTAIASLSPDNGDKTKQQANVAALQDARAKVVAAQKDLVAARADAKTVVDAVKGKPVSASASATASTTTSLGE
jgi:hypothetical protein